MKKLEKVGKSILLRTRYLNILQDVKAIIIVNKKRKLLPRCRMDSF